ncbi:MAG TPA: uracil-DNA glycosylase [Lentimicrobium sp.]|nr:uracil-DNA glycosylase [Lentimicrobium sp.]
MTNIQPQIEESWKIMMREEFDKPYFGELKQFLITEKQKYLIYPPGQFIFEAFNRTPFDKVKVVLLGQDPYHGHGQAHGLCFSVPDGIEFPPSLQNILTELKNDLGHSIPLTGNLSKWAERGVLLLNATLTVRANNAGSHQGRGWETFTDDVIRKLSEKRKNLVFLLWGKYAQNKRPLIDTSKHFIVEAPHPSPLSAYRGFMGCSAFSKTNNLLKNAGIEEIDWNLSD